MNKKELEAFAKEAAKGIKTPEDLTEFSQMLNVITIEAVLNTKNTNPLSRIIAAMGRLANA
ncbi:hypothetical protein [Vibrio splendidus]|uniref:hypothetical protein n=1 Tax=Vibrio splendidus TaxID=29497 RepID=UPI003D0A1457